MSWQEDLEKSLQEEAGDTPVNDTIKPAWQIHYPENAKDSDWRKKYVKGKHGEKVFYDRETAKGHSLNFPENTPANGASLVDFVTESNGGYIYYDEIKVRHAPYFNGIFDTFYFEKAKVAKYLNWAQVKRCKVYLNVIDLSNKVCYRASIGKLVCGSSIFNGKVGTYIAGLPSTPEVEGCFFAVEQFEEYFKLTDTECEYIESISDAEQTYIDTGHYPASEDAETESPADEVKVEVETMGNEKDVPTEWEQNLDKVNSSFEVFASSFNSWKTLSKIPDEDLEKISAINPGVAGALEQAEMLMYARLMLKLDNVRGALERLKGFYE